MQANVKQSAMEGIAESFAAVGPLAPLQRLKKLAWFIKRWLWLT